MREVFSLHFVVRIVLLCLHAFRQAAFKLVLSVTASFPSTLL